MRHGGYIGFYIGFRFEDLGFRLQGLGFGVLGLNSLKGAI